MTNRVTPVGRLDLEQVRSVLDAATAAPWDDHRPWRFHCTDTTIELSADTRLLPDADLDDRESVLSCGAALLNLRLAIRALGVYPAVQLLPDPRRPNLLAVVRPQGHTVVRAVDRELADAILPGRTDHGLFHPTPVPLAVVASLRQAARTERAWLPTLTAAHRTILYGLIPAPGRDVASESLVAVIGTFHDSSLARLQAGQAVQRVLLTATVAGLSASFRSQVVAVPSARKQLRELIVNGLWPQAVLHLGYDARRDLDGVVTSRSPRV
jgi:hypothetical protein